MLFDIKQFKVNKQTIIEFPYFSKYRKVWRNATTVAEYRAPYDSHLKVFTRHHLPENVEMEDIIEWMKNNISGSWKIVIDIGVKHDNTCDFLNSDFSLLLSRKDDYMLYKLTWI